MPIREGDLVFPAMKGIMAAGDAGLSTAELMAKLRSSLELDEHDLRPLAGRADDRFSQIVRNLKSHDTLENLNYAIYVDGRYYITEDGIAALEEEADNPHHIYQQGFDRTALSNALKNSAGHLVVEEGEIYNVKGKARKRSRIVRKAALKHFEEHDGSVKCVGCGLNPVQKFGSSAISMIEIHHTEPIALRPMTGTKQLLGELLDKLAPVCANCHRLIHRDRNNMLSVEELQAIIEEKS